jgi:tRNA G10  N-methylase Trm11
MTEKYLIVPAYGKLSCLELASVKDSGSFQFTISQCSENSAIIEAESKIAKNLAKRLGGFYKFVRICGKTPKELFEHLPLPDTPKFNWTVSEYGCDPETQEEIRSEVSTFLKASSLGKARYVKPEGEVGGRLDGSENALKLAELEKNILSKTEARIEGIDVVVHCAEDRVVYGYTEFLSDVSGYQKRDFARSYQDPTTTIGPRLARILVNLTGLQRGETLLDPFCGLGTILQEGLMCGYNVVGVDISQANVRKTITNLEWLKKEFQISPKLWSKITRADSTRLEKGNLPRIAGIATEPLLVPKFENNPTSSEAAEVLREVRLEYELIIRAFARLTPTGRKVVLVVPGIVNERGKVHTLEMESAFGSEFTFYKPSLPNVLIENPCVVPSGKKKIVQRSVYVMTRL